MTEYELLMQEYEELVEQRKYYFDDITATKERMNDTDLHYLDKLELQTDLKEDRLQIEMINERMLKDKFSALEMGVYYIVAEENKVIARRRNRGLGRRSLSFCTAGGRKGGGNR